MPFDDGQFDDFDEAMQEYEEKLKDDQRDSWNDISD